MDMYLPIIHLINVSFSYFVTHLSNRELVLSMGRKGYSWFGFDLQNQIIAICKPLHWAIVIFFSNIIMATTTQTYKYFIDFLL